MRDFVFAWPWVYHLRLMCLNFWNYLFWIFLWVQYLCVINFWICITTTQYMTNAASLNVSVFRTHNFRMICITVLNFHSACRTWRKCCCNHEHNGWQAFHDIQGYWLFLHFVGQAIFCFDCKMFFSYVFFIY